MFVAFILNGIPLEVRRQMDIRSHPASSHGWLDHPEAYMYVVAACVATITTTLIDWPVKKRSTSTALRIFILLIDIFVLAVACTSYGGTIGMESLPASDESYVKWLIVAALLCGLVGVLPDRIADCLSQPPKRNARAGSRAS